MSVQLLSLVLDLARKQLSQSNPVIQADQREFIDNNLFIIFLMHSVLAPYLALGGGTMPWKRRLLMGHLVLSFEHDR